MEAAVLPGMRQQVEESRSGQEWANIMKMTVFYAWQSDRPGKVNHYLIRDAALAACERITADKSNDWQVSLDSDTQGGAGMCDIPNTILKKIDESDILLADLTLVGQTNDGKQVPN